MFSKGFINDKTECSKGEMYKVYLTVVQKRTNMLAR